MGKSSFPDENVKKERNTKSKRRSSAFRVQCIQRPSQLKGSGLGYAVLRTTVPQEFAFTPVRQCTDSHERAGGPPRQAYSPSQMKKKSEAKQRKLQKEKVLESPLQLKSSETTTTTEDVPTLVPKIEEKVNSSETATTSEDVPTLVLKIEEENSSEKRGDENQDTKNNIKKKAVPKKRPKSAQPSRPIVNNHSTFNSNRKVKKMKNGMMKTRPKSAQPIRKKIPQRPSSTRSHRVTKNRPSSGARRRSPYVDDLCVQNRTRPPSRSIRKGKRGKPVVFTKLLRCAVDTMENILGQVLLENGYNTRGGEIAHFGETTAVRTRVLQELGNIIFAINESLKERQNKLNAAKARATTSLESKFLFCLVCN